MAQVYIAVHYGIVKQYSVSVLVNETAEGTAALPVGCTPVAEH